MDKSGDSEPKDWRDPDRARLIQRPLQNDVCPYCAASLQGVQSTKEHVVGRRFVPVGSLQGTWNVILRACASCNTTKSDLEDELSALSLETGRWTDRYSDLPQAVEDANRRAAGSFSRSTKRPVVDSGVSRTLVMRPFPGAEFSFKLVGPPQLDEQRVYLLASLQVAGFFFALTFDRATKRGWFIPGVFSPVLHSVHGNWGNPIQRWFMNKVASWAPRVVGTIADGCFRVAIRRRDPSPIWSWAVEWNRSVRVIGFFGVESEIDEVCTDMPSIEMTTVAADSENKVRMRFDTKLDDRDDILFDEPKEG